MRVRSTLVGLGSCVALVACSTGSRRDAGAQIDALDTGAQVDVMVPRVPFCQLAAPPALGLTAPPGYCVRSFAHIQHARVIRFAPGGELFVASPNSLTTSYNNAGPEPSRIALVADDDHDGVGEVVDTFLPDLDQCHALLFANGAFYYSAGTQVLRMPYTAGQRTSTAATVVANLSVNASFAHWPHTMDIADDGTIYVSRGGDDSSDCPSPRPIQGSVVALDGTTQGRTVTFGLRNPMYLRCHHGYGRCFANELTGDFWEAQGGVEKILEIREGDDWGYPCCVNRNVPTAVSHESCANIAEPMVALPLHDTPFGLDFEPGRWTDDWRGSLLVALHGSFVTWAGARVVAIDVDPVTGAPASGARVRPFVTGWDDGRRDLGRPSDVTFAPDGRLFIANDITGEIVWVAPEGLRPPS